METEIRFEKFNLILSHSHSQSHSVFQESQWEIVIYFSYKFGDLGAIY